MSALVFNVVEVLRSVDSPLFKDYRQRLRHKAKKVCQKVKKALRPSKGRVHCKDTSPHPQSRTIAVQTSFESLVQTLTHNGELDMSHHRSSLNTNQSNSYGMSRPVGASGSTTSRSSQYASHSSRTVLPSKFTSPATKKPTASVGTSTDRSSKVRPSRATTRRSESLPEASTLPHIPRMHHRSPSPVPRRRSNSSSITTDSWRSSPSHSSTGSHLSRASAYQYRPQPPSSPRPPSPARPLSPARQRRRESRTTTLSLRESVIRETSKPPKDQVSSQVEQELVRSLSRTSLRRSASLSSIHVAEPSLLLSEDIEDQLHSEKYWGSNRVPQFLRVDVATRAEPTPVTSTLAPTEKRSAKCVEDASSSVKESIRISSPTQCFAKLLHSLKAHKATFKSQQSQASIGIEGALIHGGVVGLNNLGNTCYMNSMLQCLSHTVEMTQAYLHPDSLSERKTPLAKAYTQLMQRIWSQDNALTCTRASLSKSIAPREFKTSLSRRHPLFAGNNQQDSHEFLTLFMDDLQEDMKRSQNTKKFLLNLDLSGTDRGEEQWRAYFQNEDTPLSRVFMGQLRSTCICYVCKTDSVCFDFFWNLPLSFPKNIQHYPNKVLTVDEMLKEFTVKELMDNRNLLYCSCCGKNQRVYKQITINRFPPIFVLALKRFSADGRRSKLETMVEVPEVLDFTKYASKETATGRYSGRKLKYELYAMSNHYGSLSFGHYTTVAKHYATDQWYYYSDSVVKKVPSLDPYLKSREPYVLFYRRKLADE